MDAGFESALAGSIVGFTVAVLLISLIGIASNVLLAFCVYNDAQYRRSQYAVLWAVLSGFFNIAALVYIIVQLCSKPRGLQCVQCGQWLAPESTFCPRCGRQVVTFTPEQMANFDKRRKLFLGLWIGSVVIIIAASIVVFGVFFGQIMKYAAVYGSSYHGFYNN